MSIVQFENVSKIYTSGDHVLRALDRVSFTLDEGKFVVILGPSGAGKSTLLNLLGGLDSPNEGTITVSGADISELTVIGVLLGLPAGLGTLYWMLTALAGEYEMKLMLGPLTYSVSILLTFGVSLLVGWMVARKNRKIDMVEALKNAE